MGYLLILLMILIYTCQTFFCKLYSDRYPGRSDMSSVVFSVVSGTAVALTTLAFAGFSFHPKPLTVLLGVINAAIIFSYNTVLIATSARGPYSVVSVFNAAGGILMPIVVALIFKDFNHYKWFVIAVILLAVYLVTSKKGSNTTSVTRSFLFLCPLLAVVNGSYGAMLDLQQRLTGEGDKDEMLVITYLGVVIASLAVGYIRRRKAFISDFRQTKSSLIFMLVSSACTATAANLLVILLSSGLVDSTTLLTFKQSGILVCSVLASAIVLKEKISIKNILGILLMCACLVTLSFM